MFGVPAAAYGSFNYAGAGCDNRFTSLTPFGGGFQSNVSTVNTKLQNLVGEFDAQVAFVDLDTVFNSLYAPYLARPGPIRSGYRNRSSTAMGRAPFVTVRNRSRISCATPRRS